MFVLGKRRPLCRQDNPEGKTLWAVAFRLIVEEKHWIFDSFEYTLVKRTLLSCFEVVEIWKTFERKNIMGIDPMIFANDIA